ncbi:MAG: NAD(P)H-dependent oxidoreductase [Flavobacteriales bacterium]|nr:MAG: NAD(P)H-dependent oxidoreductase [Flavobacteriales bacterium]
MNVIDSLQWRYACKKFKNDAFLSKEQINTLCHAFNLTATSYNLQPIKLVVIKDKEIQQKMADYSYNQQQAANASHVLVICIVDRFRLSDIDDYFDMEREIRGTSEKILKPYREHLKNLYKNKSTLERQESALNQAYLAMGNLLTVCALEKIDSCPMEGFNANKIDELLQLEKQNLKSVLLLPVGFRADDDFTQTLKKVRKPITETIIKI